MLPVLTINKKLFGIVILFRGNFQGILYRQNKGRSSKFCPSLHYRHSGPLLFFIHARPSLTSGPLHPLLPPPGKFFSLWFPSWLTLDLQSNATGSWSLLWPTLTLEHSLVFLLDFIFIRGTHLVCSIDCRIVYCHPQEWRWSFMQAGTCFIPSTWNSVRHITDDYKHLLNEWMNS